MENSIGKENESNSSQILSETTVDPNELANMLRKSNNMQMAWIQFAKDADATDIGLVELFKILYSIQVMVLKEQNTLNRNQQRLSLQPLKKLSIKLMKKMPSKNGKRIMDKSYFENKLCDALDREATSSEPPESKEDDVPTDDSNDIEFEFEAILNVKQEQNDEFIPFPIYKRTKHDDDEDLKESSLRPQQYESSKVHPVPKRAVPDLKLFENMKVVKKCKGFGTAKGDDDEIESEEQSLILCPALKRLVAVLNYYNSLMLSAVDGDEMLWQNRFIEFCDEHYGAYWMMEDHMHFVTNHSDLESTNQIAAVLDYKCFGDLKRCKGTKRHYRNRQQDNEDEVHFYIETINSLHFNVLHLVDVGLRVNHDDDQQADSQNEDSLVDQKVLKMNREIQMKRQKTAFPRIDGTGKNSKFSLCSTMESNDGAKGGMTKMDSVLKDFRKEVGDEAAVHRLVEFMEEQRYDTETMNEDMAVYAESKHCNVRKAMEAQGDGEQFGAIRRWLRYHRVSGSSFSTGIWWAYWPWYRWQTIESLTSHARNNWEYIDFGGHTLKSLCVYPHFDNLKKEAIGSGLISVRFWKKLTEKATRFLQSMLCKKMGNKGWGADMHFDVPRDFKVTMNHLLALLLYTDSSEYCTALSETFRAIKSGEIIEEMNKRNSLYYWTSRYLRELMICFGQQAFSTYFTGISYEMSIPQFQIGLIGPTSTSTVEEVAVRFAGVNGMLIVLKGGGSCCFNASPFSAFPEEQERIFCGSTFRDTVTSIVLVKTAKNYKVAVGAYSQFDAIFSGRRPYKMSELEVEIITESLRWITGGDDAVKHKNLDSFILETFYSFVIHKKKVQLNLENLHRSKKNRMINMVMNPLWNLYDDDENNKPIKANLLKPFVFTVFRDVHQISIDAEEYPFDLMSFLSMMQSAHLPETLELIVVKGRGWLNEGFFEKIQREYNVNGIRGRKVHTATCSSSEVGREHFERWTLTLKF